MATSKVKTSPPKSVFHDLGLEDADDLFLRAELMRKIGMVIEKKGLTQTAAGKLIDMDQPRISALMHGKITRFSTDRLIKALNDLGQDIEVRIKPTLQKKGVTRVIGGSANRSPRAA